MRVIGGTARGMRLRAPPGRDVRPTADRVREALFSSLAPALEGAAVLDLYAGAGSLGIEALSRGAARAVFVERARPALAALRANLERTGLAAGATVVDSDVARFCARPTDGPFAVVLADPPYAEPLAGVWDALSELHAAGGLADGATVVVERDKRDPDLEAEPPGFLALERRRAYGDTVLIYMRAAAGAPREHRP